MTYSGLLSSTATITHRTAGGAAGDYNAPGVTESTADVACHIEQLSESEDTAGGEVAAGAYRGFFEPDVVLGVSDLVTFDGVDYEVLGPPNYVTNPRLGVVHHLEAMLGAIVTEA